MSRPIARIGHGDFDENSPRPPVPGEETDPGCCCSNTTTPAFPNNPSVLPYKYTPRGYNAHIPANLGNFFILFF